jgi:hypothetical protein
MLKGRHEFQSTAAHKGQVMAQKANRGILHHAGARLVDLLLLNQYTAGKNQRAGALATGNEATLDQQQVESRLPGKPFRSAGLFRARVFRIGHVIRRPFKKR